jgi:hypothetical protein
VVNASVARLLEWIERWFNPYRFEETVVNTIPTIAFDKRRLLKIKLKSLAAEARIIRKEELRTTGELREQMYLHRVKDLRKEARATHLAYGFIRGKERSAIENKMLPLNSFDLTVLNGRIQAMVAKYGNRSPDELKGWLGL